MATKFYFIFSPNNSGTTAMSQYLQSQTSGYLPPFGHNEGQMAPTVRKMMRSDPWNPERRFDWRFIRSEWQQLAEQAGRTTFIEASPPNILRVDAVVDEFQPNMKAVFSISSPYLQISSSVKNYHKEFITDEVLAEFARLWLFKAEVQMRNAEKYRDRFTLVKYEDFCANPDMLNRAFGIPVNDIKAITGKNNSRIGQIIDLTAKNISFLTVFEFMKISEVLSQRQDILDFFGYPLMTMRDYNSMLAADLGLMQAGLLDRFSWEMRRSGAN